MPSPREIATRLGIDQLPIAQRVYRTVAFQRYFARGYRFGERFPQGQAASAPSPEGASSELERYAESHSEGPGIFKWQHYFEIYDRHLARFRGAPVTLVEIGVAGGGSLGMWREYLGAQAQIVGVDIDPACKRFEQTGVEVAIGDQGSAGFWDSFLRTHERIDIVIDDGGHLPEQQVVTLESLLPRIAPGGVFICEDIHGPFQPFHAYVDGLTRPLSEIGFAGESYPAGSLQRQVASVHRYPLMTVIEKTNASPASFEARRHGTEWPKDWVPA
jgi:predicted O-methyltransferase YrrM